MVQRSYNAFAVRVQGQEGVDRRVVPAGETGEGELCIEMRIRLYSDGLMSSQLSRLIKVREGCRSNGVCSGAGGFDAVRGYATYDTH